jgi:hypothetical protein
MATASVLFVFSSPATQWIALTGSTASTGFCTPDMALLDGGGVVSISTKAAGKSFTYKGKPCTTYPAASVTLVVAAGQSPLLTFNVSDASGNPNSYVMGGIALQNMGTGGGTGGASFPTTSIQVDSLGTTTLSLQNTDLAQKGATTTYDFWVMVQNSNGDVGLIDPLVTNSN